MKSKAEGRARKTSRKEISEYWVWVQREFGEDTKL